MSGEIGTWPLSRRTNPLAPVLSKTNEDLLSYDGRSGAQPDFEKVIASVSAETSFGSKFQSILSHLPYIGVTDPTQPGNTTATSPASDVQKQAADYIDEIANLIFSRTEEKGASAVHFNDIPTSTEKTFSDLQVNATGNSLASRAREHKSMVDGFVQKAISEYRDLNDEIHNARQQQFLAMEFFAKPNGPRNQ